MKLPNPLLLIDSLFYRWATKISHWLQRTTGLTNFFIARIGIGLMSLECVLRIVQHYWTIIPGVESHWLGVLANLMMLGFNIVRLQWTHRNEELLYRSKLEWRLEVHGPGQNYVRVFWTLFFTIPEQAFTIRSSLLYYAMTTAFADGFTIFFYFAAVVPLPPGRSKISEWISSLMPRKLANATN